MIRPSPHFYSSDTVLGDCQICGSRKNRLWHFGAEFRIEHDGFIGAVIGHYETFEGKRGVVLQQVGTRVVHVYGEKWLKEKDNGNQRKSG